LIASTELAANMSALEGVLCWLEIPARDIIKVYVRFPAMVDVPTAVFLHDFNSVHQDFYKAAFPDWEFRDQPKASGEEHQVVHIVFGKSSSKLSAFPPLLPNCSD
jgi:hypothetical protein